MAVFSYQKQGKTYYGFHAYLGTDELTGKQKHTNRKGYRTRKDAEIAYAVVRSGQKLEKRSETFRDVYREWIPIYAKTIKGSSLAKVESLFELHVLPELGDRLIKGLTLSSVQKYMTRLIDSGFSQYREIKNYMNRLFVFAIHQGYTDINPCTNLILPKKPRKRVREEDQNFYSIEQLREFLECCERDLPLKWYAFFRLLAYTGLRRGEALALTWEDIDFQKMTLDVNKTLTLTTQNGKKNQRTLDSPKTYSSAGTLDLDRETVAILERHKLEQMQQLRSIKIKGQLVFPNSKNELMVLSTPIKYMQRVIEQNGLKRITLHGLRHTHCSLLFLAGATVKETQTRMRHSSVQTTLDIYTHVTRDQQLDITDKFAKLMDQ